MLMLRRAAASIRRGFATELSAADVEVRLSPEELEQLERQKKIEKSRNKSRLSPQHFNTVHGRMPYDEPQCRAHFTQRYHRKMYGLYGAESGIDPRFCWMSKQQLLDKKEYESVACPFTLQEMIDIMKRQRKEEKESIDKRQAEIAKKHAKFGKWKEELLERNAIKLAAATAAKEKKERLIEEVRRHIGFNVHPNDERFQALLAEKEKELKKKEKAERQAIRDAKTLLKLQKQSTQIS